MNTTGNASEPPDESEPRLLARYECKVSASNRNVVEYGTPVSVLAASRQEAVERAIELGWSGHRRDARVAVLSVADEAAW